MCSTNACRTIGRFLHVRVIEASWTAEHPFLRAPVKVDQLLSAANEQSTELSNETFRP